MALSIVIVLVVLLFYYPPFASIAKGEVFVLLYVFYPPFARKSEGRGICFTVCLFVHQRFLDNPRADSRQSSHAGNSGSGRVFSPFGGWRPLADGKRGK